MTDNMNHLAAASAALLDAHEKLFLAGADALAEAVRDLADDAMHAARQAIKEALARPGHALERRTQLLAAINLDGIESVLATAAARCFAEAAEAGALEAA